MVFPLVLMTGLPSPKFQTKRSTCVVVGVTTAVSVTCALTVAGFGLAVRLTLTGADGSTITDVAPDAASPFESMPVARTEYVPDDW